MKTLIHDPLVEWISGSSRSSKSNAEPTNKMVIFEKLIINLVDSIEPPPKTLRNIDITTKNVVYSDLCTHNYNYFIAA